MSFNASWALAPSYYRAPYPAELDAKGTPPMDCQFAGVEYALSRSNALIADEPGVGKTWQGILVSNAIEARRTLVIAPASLILNWEREIWRASTIENVITYPILKGKDGVSGSAHYTILSYNMLRNDAIVSALMSLRWDNMILDEAHKIKDTKWNTFNTPICREDALPSVVGRCTLLSGSPMPNQPIEIWRAAKLCDWSSIDNMTEHQFREYYYATGSGFVTKKVWDDKAGRFTAKAVRSNAVRNKPRRQNELNRRLRESFMVRRLKADVLPQLPARQWSLVPVSKDAGVRKALKSEAMKAAESLFEIDNDGFDADAPVDGAVATARRLLGEAKAPQVAAFCEELLEGGLEKLVIGFFNKDVGHALHKSLAKYGAVHMDGTTPLKKRQEAVDQFQGVPSVRAIIGQFLVMGEGYTLTASDTVVNAEPDWTPGKNGQLFDRVHRMGQKSDKTICHMMYVADSLDERILSRVIEKDRNIYQALDADA